MRLESTESQRSLIRKKMAEKLNPLVQGRVFLSRVYPLDKNALPGLTVFINRDEVNQDYVMLSGEQAVQWHTLTLTVQLHVAGNDKIDETIDRLEAQICQCLQADVTLGGLVTELRWLSTEISLSGEGAKPVGLADMQFSVVYQV